MNNVLNLFEPILTRVLKYFLQHYVKTEILDTSEIFKTGLRNIDLDVDLLN